MSSLQFSGVSLNALAQVGDDGRHLWRALSFADGCQKIVGALVGQADGELLFNLNADCTSAHRIEITAGECEVAIDGGEFEYYRAGQSFLLPCNVAIVIKPKGLLQYVRHFEG